MVNLTSKVLLPRIASVLRIGRALPAVRGQTVEAGGAADPTARRLTGVGPRVAGLKGIKARPAAHRIGVRRRRAGHRGEAVVEDGPTSTSAAAVVVVKVVGKGAAASVYTTTTAAIAVVVVR